MRPERELAATFKLSRRKVREAIDSLVEAEVLVREHGSGVYVRKVPRQRGVDATPADESAFEKLFITEERRPALQLPETKRTLRFEAWWKTDFHNETARLFRAGLEDQARALGHELCFHEIATGHDADKAALEMLASVNRKPGDGYIIHVPFANASDRFDTLLRGPAIYVSMGRQPLRHQPMVRMDGSESIFQAVELLHAQGYRRIGMLGLETQHESQDLVSSELYYQLALERLGLPFIAPYRARMVAARVKEVLSKLLSGPAPCDALYITDDYIARLAEPLLRKMGVRVGETFGFIALSNRGSSVQQGHEHWSRMEFDPYNNGKLAINCLVRSIESAGEELLSFSHHATWTPGSTHLSTLPYPRG